MDRKAFTLIEQLAVLTIVATLVSLVVGVVRYASHAARLATVQSDLSVLSDSLQDHFAEEGEYPSDVDNLRDDPWGVPYAYTSAPASFAVWSFGPDGEADTGDELRLGQ